MSARVCSLTAIVFTVCSFCMVSTSWAQTKSPDEDQSKACLKLEILKQPAAPKDAQNDSSEAKIRRALESHVRVELVEAELGPFCRELAKKFGINVLLDREALEEYDLGEDTLLNYSCRDISVKTALRRTLREHDLTWIIRYEVLIISTEDVAQECREIKIYDVADLVTIPRGKDGYVFDFGPLVDIVTSTVEPESWVDMGGNGTIDAFEQDRLQVLIISQTAEVHEEIESLLANLRVHLPKKVPGKGKPLIAKSAALDKRGENLQPSIKTIAPLDEITHRVLDKRIDVNLDGVPLSQFAALLEKKLGISTQIDVEALLEYDLSPDIPITAHFSGISARSALALVLRQHDLGYTIEENCLVISTKDCIECQRKTVIYDVADLVESRDGDLSAPDFEPLIEIIIASVEIESWVDYGGNGTIEPFNGGGMRVLVVKQTWSVQYQIKKLLAQIRKVRREGHGRPLPPNHRKTARIGRRRMLAIGGMASVFPMGSRSDSRKRIVVKDNPDRDELVRGNNQFAFDLFEKLRAKAKDNNVFFSPMSISTAVAMAHAGARGETAKEIAQAMHFTLPTRRLYPACASLLDASRGSSGHELTVANRLWMQKDYHFRDEYLRITRDHFGAEGKLLDFTGRPEEAMQEINHWTAQATRNRIQQLITLDMITDYHPIMLVLTNAVYFKSEWLEPFEKRDTTRQPFHAPQGPKQVPLMELEDDSCQYAQIDDPSMQILKKPYQGDDLSMIVLLPAEKPGSLDKLEAKLTGDNLDMWLKDLNATTVKVFLPRFRLDTDYRLEKSLESLGMKSAFGSEDVDFSGIGGDPGELFIAWVVHKATVEVDEEGTVAAAATAWGGMGGMMPSPKKTPEFRADRPFIFLIRDDRTGSILFLGRLCNP